MQWPIDEQFLGNGLSASGLIGSYSEIQYAVEGLCVQSATSGDHLSSWSLSWVSIDGRPTNDGYNIFQGGYATCPSPAVSSGSCPWNNGNPYYWVYYLREASSECGVAFGTGFLRIADITPGTHFFQVSKVGSQYNFYIDEHLYYHRSLADIETCWTGGGVKAVEYQGEMLNNGDQGGGSLSDYQDFGANQYQNATGWHDMNRTLASNCDANSYPGHWHCITSHTIPNTFKSWDDRAP